MSSVSPLETAPKLDNAPTSYVVNTYHPMKANLLLKTNIDALLRARGQTRKDLAMWCRRTESWISKAFRDPNRSIPLRYFDRIADFFGLATYQLFQPGITPYTERRSGKERRSGIDRRLSHIDRIRSMMRTDPYRAAVEAVNEAERIETERRTRAQDPKETRSPRRKGR
jgi:hypothetical protein